MVFGLPLVWMSPLFTDFFCLRASLSPGEFCDSGEIGVSGVSGDSRVSGNTCDSVVVLW